MPGVCKFDFFFRVASPPPLLKKFRLTLAHPLKSYKELNFGFQSLFDKLDADL
jgi:hypothetical protein